MDREAALAAMLRAIDRLLGRELTPTQLQLVFLEELTPEEGAANLDPGMQLWHATVTNLAYYLHCDFERPVLEASLRIIIESVRTTGRANLTPITTSSCFIDALKLRTIPLPLNPDQFRSVGFGELTADADQDCAEFDDNRAV